MISWLAQDVSPGTVDLMEFKAVEETAVAGLLAAGVPKNVSGAGRYVVQDLPSPLVGWPTLAELTPLTSAENGLGLEPD